MTLIEHKESTTVNGQFIRNHSTVAYSQVTETGTVPASLLMESSERVAPDSVVTATIAGDPAEILPWGNTVGAGEVALDRERGLWKFSASDSGKAVSVTYDPAGTVMTAAKMEVVGQGAVKSVNGKTGAVELDATDIPFGSGSVDDAVQDLYGTKQNVDTDLTALANISGVGFISRIASGAVAPRVLTAGVGITVTNGGGISGNPTVALNPAASNTWTAAQTLPVIFSRFVMPLSKSIYAQSSNQNVALSADDVWVQYWRPSAYTVDITLPPLASVADGHMIFLLSISGAGGTATLHGSGAENIDASDGGYANTATLSSDKFILYICRSDSLSARWRLIKLN